MTFAELMQSRSWLPLRNCPGRYVLRGGGDVTIAELVGADLAEQRFRVPAARDEVIVAALEDGGVISYRHADGSHTHTLNTPDGFVRKLDQLGIVLPPRRELG
jgi:hypothetical protein